MDEVNENEVQNQRVADGQNAGATAVDTANGAVSQTAPVTPGVTGVAVEGEQDTPESGVAGDEARVDNPVSTGNPAVDAPVNPVPPVAEPETPAENATESTEEAPAPEAEATEPADTETKEA